MRTTSSGDGRTLKRHIGRTLYDAFGGACLAGLAVYDTLSFFVILAITALIRFGVYTVSVFAFAEDAQFKAHSRMAAYDLRRRQEWIERIDV